MARRKRPGRAALTHWLGCLALLSLLGACRGHASHTLEARQALDARAPQRALELYNEELDVGSGSELPSDDDADTALFLLDRSMISQALTHYEDASRDLESADKRVEMLDFSRSTADEIGRYLFSDDAGEYKARPYEKLLINTMNMVNYLARGELGGAKVEARRLAVMQKYLSEAEDDPTASMLGPSSYLAGFVFEQAGDANEALRYYDEALRATDYASLREPIARLSARGGYRSPRLTSAIEGVGQLPDAQGTGEVLVIVCYGRVPALHAERIPIGLALTYGALFMGPGQEVAARRMAGQGLVTWVNYPELDKGPLSYAGPAVELDGHLQAIDTITSVDALVRSAYEKSKGQVIASAIVRMIARGAVGAGAGTGVARGSGSGLLGMLVALGSQAALVAADTPDTRSWATLPARIGFARIRVPAGRHRLRVTVHGASRAVELDVPAGGYRVVNLSELSQ